MSAPRGPLAARLPQLKFETPRRFSASDDLLPGSLSLSHLRCGKPAIAPNATIPVTQSGPTPSWWTARNTPSTSPKRWWRRCKSASPRAGSFRTLMYNMASSAESVGGFWFRESSQVVIKGNFHSIEGTKAIGSSGNYSDFVIEALNGTVGDFSFGSKPIQDQRLMGAQHPSHLFHRFQTAPHGPEAQIGRA